MVRLSPMARFLRTMLHGANMLDIMAISQIVSMHRQIYLLDSAQRTLRSPLLGEIPWPVIWLLTRHHRKHIWILRRKPCLDAFLSDLQQNERRWGWHFAKLKPSPGLWFKIPRAQVTAAPPPDAPELRAWLASLRRNLTVAARHAIMKHSSQVRSSIPLVKYALQLLRTARLVPVPNDKEPGFTLLSRGQLLYEQRRILGKSAYRPVDENSRVDVGAMRKLYIGLCREAAKMEDTPTLCGNLVKSLHVPGAAHSSRLTLSIKTHKDPGSVEPRNVHAAPRYAYSGLSLFVSHRCTKILNGIPHLLKGSEEFVSRIRGTTAQPEDVLVKMDVKDFHVRNG